MELTFCSSSWCREETVWSRFSCMEATFSPRDCFIVSTLWWSSSCRVLRFCSISCCREPTFWWSSCCKEPMFCSISCWRFPMREVDSAEVSSQDWMVLFCNWLSLSCTFCSSCSNLCVMEEELLSQESWASPCTVASWDSTSCLSVVSWIPKSFRLLSIKRFTNSECSWARSLLCDWKSWTVTWISFNWRAKEASRSWIRPSISWIEVLVEFFVSFNTVFSSMISDSSWLRIADKASSDSVRNFAFRSVEMESKRAKARFSFSSASNIAWSKTCWYLLSSSAERSCSWRCNSSRFWHWRFVSRAVFSAVMAAEVNCPSVAVILSESRPFTSVRLLFSRFSVSVRESIKFDWICSCSWAATWRNCSKAASKPSLTRWISSLKEATSPSKLLRSSSIFCRSSLSFESITPWASSIVARSSALYSSNRFLRFTERVETASLILFSVASILSVTRELLWSTSAWCWLIRSSKVVAKAEAVSSTCCSINCIFSWIKLDRESTSCWHWLRPSSSTVRIRSNSVFTSDIR